MSQPIAVVGIACEYPDARSPRQLWENVLARRRAFRRMPPERLRSEDYLAADPSAPDRTYAATAALIGGYTFDRVAFRVAGSTYRSADPAHWLALDVASRALADAGLAGGGGLPRESTGVFVGNTLTGETSRANTLRLRWPFARRVVEEALAAEGWDAPRRRAFLDRLEVRYKEPFPPLDAESLAGGLSNTIAGRICNHFDFQGSGYVVDGACASSLLAVTQACAALASGDLDAALAGGVDLSLDPFELVGFAKAGALTPGRMRVYDAHSDGFWPGEGCGFALLMRLGDALAIGRRPLAVIRGWGLSSDGRGGITRPEVEGQVLALRRAYLRAGCGASSVDFFEGHGTGTRLGDETELRALTRARGEPGNRAPAAIGSIKANIGHTKAAAGIAGLLKATMALRDRILPPTTACETPHPLLREPGATLRVLDDGEPWPSGRPARAGVSAMGFGGINAHVVLEATEVDRPSRIGRRRAALLASAQDVELILLDADDRAGLRGEAARLRALASGLSIAEVGDLAASLHRRLAGRPARVGLLAASPDELADRLDVLDTLLAGKESINIDPRLGVFLGIGATSPRVGFLFPGQGTRFRLDGGAAGRRFGPIRSALADAGRGEVVLGDAAAAQPAIAAASAAGLRLMEHFGIAADLAIGHSLGELSALHWAGALDAGALARVASARGLAMARRGESGGAMASLAAGWRMVEPLLGGESVVVAARNGPGQTVVSGPSVEVGRVVNRARGVGIGATQLDVSHAFHSPMVGAAAPALADALAIEAFRPASGVVVSSVTGTRLGPEADLRDLLCRQLTAPVLFWEAVEAAGPVDLWIEVGPGTVLRGLLREIGGSPVVSLEIGGPSLAGPLGAVAAAFALGAPVAIEAAFAGRFVRPIDPDARPRFFRNPCEQAPWIDPPTDQQDGPSSEPGPGPDAGPPLAAEGGSRGDVLELLRRLLANRAELPESSIRDESRMLDDLHLNSISVGEVVSEAARTLGFAPPGMPTALANASLAEMARALGQGSSGRPGEAREAAPAGVADWVRPFAVVWDETPRPRPRTPAPGGGPWRLVAPAERPESNLWCQALREAVAGPGVVACLAPGLDDPPVESFLETIRALRVLPGQGRLVVIHHDGGGAAFARSVHMELPGLTTVVLDLPPGHPDAPRWLVDEVAAASGFVEARYDPDGRRTEPFLRPIDQSVSRPGDRLGPGDVLLVSGGGKGISAECALALARRAGAAVALLGRSDPAADTTLAANLDRFDAFGIRFCYARADVADAESVRLAVAGLESKLGPFTAILHGAGVNEPRRLEALGADEFGATLAPKLAGARNLVAAVRPDRLRLFLAFGSIIARTGLPGEAHYAIANEWLARLVADFGRRLPTCRCLTIEWSVWSGLGMGERLERVEALRREGITPISPDAGVATACALVDRAELPSQVVVAGRFGDPPTLRFRPAELPFFRFLERARYDAPGVELVVDAELSDESDLYLDDHVFRGERLLPAVIGLEAMAQAAMGAIRSPVPPSFEDVRFDRPVVVPRGSTLSIRLAALAATPGRVEVALRSEATGFAVDHFRATCHFDPAGPPRLDAPPPAWPDDAPGVPLDPGRDLYGPILFQGGRFRRLAGYRRLEARGCDAEIAPGPVEGAGWFGPYLPRGLALGDPGARDAALHAIQACIPHATILPVGVGRLTIAPTGEAGPRRAVAREISRDGDLLIYELDVVGPGGRVEERWEGLRLRAVESVRPDPCWAGPLLGPYLERRIGELLSGLGPGPRVAVGQDEVGGRRDRSDRAIGRAAGRASAVLRRPDGRPEILGAESVSASHAGMLTLAVAGEAPLACDVEAARERPEAAWLDLLGRARVALADRIGLEAGESRALAATRLWVAGECLVKAGLPADSPLVLDAVPAGDGWVVLANGTAAVATWALRGPGLAEPIVFGVLVGRGPGER